MKDLSPQFFRRYKNLLTVAKLAERGYYYNKDTHRHNFRQMIKRLGYAEFKRQMNINE